MNKNIEAISEEIIYLLKNSPEGKIIFNDVLAIKEIDQNTVLAKTIIRSLKEDYGLIEHNGPVIMLRKKGYKFISFERLRKDELIEEENITVERQIKGFDLTLKKWQKKTFWWLFLFAFVAFILSIYSLIESRSQLKHAEQLEQRIKETELELYKLRSSISNQKKETL